MERGARLVTGGTENHLMIIDITKYGINGRQGESVLREAGLTVNRNTIPFDPHGPWYTSGIRIGTPATTTLGMGKDEMREIGDIIVDVLSNTIASKTSKASAVVEPETLKKAQERVADLLGRYPLYPEIEIE